ncbi:hypothetical protein V1514DRAFT_323558 [Lipomyces japonicus]|uniref:uncharacterized protein n=1 Tax=Lipomyces japonicus TaxID=56871 RepID=UPI0034CFD818
MTSVSSEHALELAKKLKAQGNDFFADQEYKEAIELYTRAILVDFKEPVYYSNRALCYLKLEEWFSAEKDCTAALNYAGDNDKTILKILWRRAVSRKNLGNLEGAEEDLKTALRIDPNDNNVKSEINALAWEKKKSKRSKRTNLPGTNLTQQSATLPSKAEIAQPKPKASQSTSDIKDISTETKKIQVSKKTKKSNDVKPANAIPTSSQNQAFTVPILRVDTLPSHLLQSQLKSSSPTNSNIPPKSHSTSTSSSNVTAVPDLSTGATLSQAILTPYKPIELVSAPFALPSKPNLYDFTQLLRRPVSDRAYVLAYFYHNVPPKSLKTIFGRGGIEGDYINPFLDGIFQEGEKIRSRSVQDKLAFVIRTTEIIDGICDCNRFSIAKLFLDDKKLKATFAAVNEISNEIGGFKNWEKAKLKWQKS